MCAKAKHYNLACIAIFREKSSKESLYLMLDTDDKQVYIYDKYKIQDEIDKIFNLVDIIEDGIILFKHQYPIRVLKIENLNDIKFSYKETNEDEIVKVEFDKEIDVYNVGTVYRCAVEVVLDDDINGSRPYYNYLITSINNKELSVSMLYGKNKDFSVNKPVKVNRIKVNTVETLNNQLEKINNKRYLLNLENIEIQYLTSKITGKSIMYKLKINGSNLGSVHLPKELYTMTYDMMHWLIEISTNLFIKHPKISLIISDEQYKRLLNQIEMFSSMCINSIDICNGLGILIKEGIIIVK